MSDTFTYHNWRFMESELAVQHYTFTVCDILALCIVEPWIYVGCIITTLNAGNALLLCCNGADRAKQKTKVLKLQKISESCLWWNGLNFFLYNTIQYLNINTVLGHLLLSVLVAFDAVGCILFYWDFLRQAAIKFQGCRGQKHTKVQ
jgi:hypothetical protein